MKLKCLTLIEVGLIDISWKIINDCVLYFAWIFHIFNIRPVNSLEATLFLMHIECTSLSYTVQWYSGGKIGACTISLHAPF